MILSFLVACVGMDSGLHGNFEFEVDAMDTASSTGPGTLALAFQVDADLVPEMDEPPVGVVLGAVYAEADADEVGSNDGAVPLYEFSTDPLDLVDPDGSQVAVTTPLLDAQAVWILACLDSDGNGCECADPVTLPNDNKVLVVGAEETTFHVTLGLLHPC